MIRKALLQDFANRYIELTGHSPSIAELSELDETHATTIHVIQRRSGSFRYARSTFLPRKNFRALLRQTLCEAWPFHHLN